MLNSKAVRLPRLIVLIAALAMLLSVFLPQATATGERAEWINEYSDTVVDAELGFTAAELRHVSALEFARILSEQSAFYTVIFILLLVLCAATVLFALLGRAIPVLVFDVLSLGMFYLHVADYRLRGYVPSERYRWGIGHYLFVVMAAVAFGCAVWLLVKKVQLKKGAKVPQSE